MQVNFDEVQFPPLDPDRIPKHKQYEIAKGTFKAICRFFEQPGVQERFEAWKAEQERLRAQKGEE